MGGWSVGMEAVYGSYKSQGVPDLEAVPRAS
jgi:hypothetical protein